MDDWWWDQGRIYGLRMEACAHSLSLVSQFVSHSVNEEPGYMLVLSYMLTMRTMDSFSIYYLIEKII